MAFLTMIAPLITLTYPIDKMKDNKAQAFTFWIREYIFNALIQVVHLVIYYCLVGSALSLVESFPLYAVIAIAFITPAEKLIRKMFGFNNAETIGTLGAAATGGLAATAINKLKKLPKTPKGGSDGSNKIRTASENPVNAIQHSRGGLGATNLAQAGTGVNLANVNSTTGNKRSIVGGITKVGGRYLGPALKGGFRSAAGGFMGLSGAIIGASAALAQGDLEGVIPTTLAGGAAGKNIGQGVADFVINGRKVKTKK